MYGPPYVILIFFRPALKESTVCPKYDSNGPQYLIWNRYHMVHPTYMYDPPHMYVWSTNMYVWSPPHVKCLHVLYESSGPPYLTWNRYCMVHHMYVWSPYVILIFFRPALKESTVCPKYDSNGPQYLIWNRNLMVPPYLMWNRYHMVPHMWSVFMSVWLLWSTHTLYRIGIIWSPICYEVWSPHVLYDLWSPTCPSICMYVLSTCTIWFFQDSFERAHCMS